MHINDRQSKMEVRMLVNELRTLEKAEAILRSLARLGEPRAKQALDLVRSLLADFSEGKATIDLDDAEEGAE